MKSRSIAATLVLKRLSALEQVLMLIGLCGTGLVMSDLLRTGLATVSPLGGLLLAGSGALFWWRAWHHAPGHPVTAPPKSDTGVLQSLAALDQQMLQQLDRAVSLSEASSLNTAERVTDLHKLAGQLVDYLVTAK